MDEAAQDFAVVNQEDAGHLAYIADRFAESAGSDERALQAADPDFGTHDLAEAATCQTKRPIQLATWVTYERGRPQSVVFGELGTLRLVAHVHENNADSLFFDVFLNC